MHNYLAREDERRGPQVTKDTKTIGSAYDQYLQNAVPFQTSSYVALLSGQTHNYLPLLSFCDFCSKILLLLQVKLVITVGPG